MLANNGFAGSKYCSTEHVICTCIYSTVQYYAGTVTVCVSPPAEECPVDRSHSKSLDGGWYGGAQNLADNPSFGVCH